MYICISCCNSERKAHIVFDLSRFLSHKVLQHVEIKRILRNEYGWPGNFKRDAWIKYREMVWYELKHRFKVEN
jgi:hypothetical protein